MHAAAGNADRHWVALVEHCAPHIKDFWPKCSRLCREEVLYGFPVCFPAFSTQEQYFYSMSCTHKLNFYLGSRGWLFRLLLPGFAKHWECWLLELSLAEIAMRARIKESERVEYDNHVSMLQVHKMMLYRKDIVSTNAHHHQHQGTDIDRLGAPVGRSAFGAEGVLGVVKAMRRNTNAHTPMRTVMRTLLLQRALAAVLGVRLHRNRCG